MGHCDRVACDPFFTQTVEKIYLKLCVFIHKFALIYMKFYGII